MLSRVRFEPADERVLPLIHSERARTQYYIPSPHHLTIEPNSKVNITTRIDISIREGSFARIENYSRLLMQHDVTNESSMIIDTTPRPLIVTLHNRGDAPCRIKRGDFIGILVIEDTSIYPVIGC